MRATGALLLDRLFGLGVEPCTYACMAPMLGAAVAGSRWSYAVALLLAHGAGHRAVIVAAGSSLSRVQRRLDWGGSAKGPARLRQGYGILVIAGAIRLIYTAG